MRVIKHYTVPSSASDKGSQLLRFLADLDRKHYKKVAGKDDLSDQRCLECYAKRAGLGRDAYQKWGTIWNAEYVIALILKGQGEDGAIPDGWLTQHTKASKPPAQAPVVVQPCLNTPTDERRYGLVHWYIYSDTQVRG